MDTRTEIVKWHRDNGGANIRLAGHALRLLNEAVELCVAAGASADEIGSRVAAEIAKSASRWEFQEPVTFDNVRNELADVTFLADVIAHHTGNVNLETEREKKLAVLHKRAWEPDADGVLWRPGFCPNQPFSKRPVAFRVRDCADGWILYQDEGEAQCESDERGALLQGLYVRDGTLR